MPDHTTELADDGSHGSLAIDFYTNQSQSWGAKRCKRVCDTQTEYPMHAEKQILAPNRQIRWNLTVWWQATTATSVNAPHSAVILVASRSTRREAIDRNKFEWLDR